ncbi:MAG: hypothetical protein R3C11_11535 [Planctomycetaceae bacterium]
MAFCKIANEQNSAIIVASHILSDVEPITDQIAILQSGRIQLQANLEDFRETCREILFEQHVYPSPPDNATLLGLDPEQGVIWVKFNHEEEAEAILYGELERRPVNLERLYLAVTQHHSSGTQINSTNEVTV